MKKYISPNVEFVALVSADVITMSVNDSIAPSDDAGLYRFSYGDLDFN